MQNARTHREERVLPGCRGHTHRRVLVGAVGVLALVLTACEAEEPEPEPGDAIEDVEEEEQEEEEAPDDEAAEEDVVEEAATFPDWEQDFDADAQEWIGDEVEGESGWCGTIEHQAGDAGPVEPSVGDGYALGISGPCNEFYAGIFGDDFRSGPFAGETPLAEEWPEAGYVMELDVYLDPDEETTFDHYNAISLLDVREEEGLVASIRYFQTPVVAENGSITVMGEEVDEPGWHTFRHTFSEGADGGLAVEFILERDGAEVFTAPIEETGEMDPEPASPTSEFEVTNVGSAYIWLHIPEEGRALPIDRYRVLDAA